MAYTKQSALIINDGYDVVSITQLRPHPDNPNVGDEQSISESIAANGFYGSVLVQKSTGYILAGNHRWHSAIKAGLSDIPVIWADVDDIQAKRIMLADNRTNRKGQDDALKVAELLQEVLSDSGDVFGTGYSMEDLDELIKGLGDAHMEAAGELEPETAGDTVATQPAPSTKPSSPVTSAPAVEAAAAQQASGSALPPPPSSQGTPIENTTEGWKGMPEFKSEDQLGKSIKVYFKTDEDRDAFAALVGQTITEATKYIWYPKAEIQHYSENAYVSAAE